MLCPKEVFTRMLDLAGCKHASSFISISNTVLTRQLPAREERFWQYFFTRWYLVACLLP